jgi:ribosomal protein S18
MLTIRRSSRVFDVFRNVPLVRTIRECFTRFLRCSHLQYSICSTVALPLLLVAPGCCPRLSFRDPDDRDKKHSWRNAPSFKQAATGTVSPSAPVARRPSPPEHSSDASDEDLTRPLSSVDKRSGRPGVDRAVGLKSRQEELYARDDLYEKSSPVTALRRLQPDASEAGSVFDDEPSPLDIEDAVLADEDADSVVPDRRNIPELQRAAREAYITASSDARVSRLAFAAAAPPPADSRRRFMHDGDSSNMLSLKIDYCIFCYHGLHLLNHEVRAVLNRASLTLTALLECTDLASAQNIALLTKFVSDRGFILPKRFTHCCAKHQRK